VGPARARHVNIQMGEGNSFVCEPIKQGCADRRKARSRRATLLPLTAPLAFGHGPPSMQNVPLRRNWLAVVPQ